MGIQVFIEGDYLEVEEDGDGATPRVPLSLHPEGSNALLFWNGEDELPLNEDGEQTINVTFPQKSAKPIEVIITLDNDKDVFTSPYIKPAGGDGTADIKAKPIDPQTLELTIAVPEGAVRDKFNFCISGKDYDPVVNITRGS